MLFTFGRNAVPNSSTHDFIPSRLLWLLALTTFEVGSTPVFGFELSLSFDTAYTIPLTKPIKIAETLGKVTGASKKISPDTAIGSLFSAPTIEYVVDEVALTHQAEVYEMKMEAMPVKIIAPTIAFLDVSGKFLIMFSADQFSKPTEATKNSGIVSRLL